MSLLRRVSRHVTSGPHAHLFSTSVNDTLQSKLRALLRESAQPVAVVTALMPGHPESSRKALFRGATLSSFTSIAMEPYPLVSFALKLPSRMATALLSAPLDAPSHMVISLLAEDQADAALMFSRPDLHPDPFSEVPYSLTDYGLPVIDGCLGAFSCKLAAKPLQLYGVEFLEGNQNYPADDATNLSPNNQKSELFIARVTKIEKPAIADEAISGTKGPLLYHRRTFTSCLTVDKLHSI